MRYILTLSEQQPENPVFDVNNPWCFWPTPKMLKYSNPGLMSIARAAFTAPLAPRERVIARPHGSVGSGNKPLPPGSLWGGSRGLRGSTVLWFLEIRKINFLRSMLEKHALSIVDVRFGDISFKRTIMYSGRTKISHSSSSITHYFDIF